MPKPRRTTRRVLTEVERELLRAALEREAWARGELTFLLHADQRRVRAELEASTAARYVLEIARRWGKTWLLVVLALETCLRKPKARVVYGAPTLKDLGEFILPTLEAVSARAPPEFRGEYRAGSGHWVLPNGSYIHLFGCDDKRKANRGRGPGADLVILDEAGFIPILRYVLRSVLRPQTLHSGARMIIGSTPAEEPDHDFTAVAERAEARGAYARRTIYDNPRLTSARVAEFIAEDAADEGLSVDEYVTTDTFRREYLAERVVDAQLVVIPEWAELRDVLRVRRPRPPYFDGYVSLDFGGADPHFGLLGYWDFKRAVLVIEREVFLHDGETTQDLAQGLKRAEREAWGTDLWHGTVRGVKEGAAKLLEALPEEARALTDKAAPKQPFARFADNDLQLIRDLLRLHGYLAIPTEKTDKRYQVNALRIAMRGRRVEVDPSCEHLDRHLRVTLWKDAKRKDFARRAGEHGDGVDALIYMHRNVDEARNPYPAEAPSLDAVLSLESRQRRTVESTSMANVMFGANANLAKTLRGR